MRVKNRVLFLLCLTPVPLFTVVIILMALGNHTPSILFTSNLLANGPSSDMTVLEQALVNQIHDASLSIDAAVYDFNRGNRSFHVRRS
jgi:hypothetical protein